MKNSKGMQLINFLASLIILLSIIISCSKTKESSSSSSSDKKDSENASITMSANQLCSDYNANEVSADNKYKGKVLEVNGVVEEIRKDFLDNIIVELKGSEFLSNVDCAFGDDKSSTANLSKGQKVTIIGKCDGFLMKSVQLKKCRIK